MSRSEAKRCEDNLSLGLYERDIPDTLSRLTLFDEFNSGRDRTLYSFGLSDTPLSKSFLIGRAHLPQQKRTKNCLERGQYVTTLCMYLTIHSFLRHCR